MRCWRISLILILASCAVDEPEPEPEALGEHVAAVTGCTAPGTQTGVCNVGMSDTGALAVQYQNAWWSLDYNGGFWAVANNVAATPIDVIPQQTITVTNPCDSVCNSCAGMTGSAYTGCQNACTSCRNQAPPSTRIESLRYAVAVNGLTYNLEAYQTSMDTRARSPDQTIETRSQVSQEFRIGLLDPDDGNPWSVRVLPRRATSNPAPAGNITVVSATYGGNAGAPIGNMTRALAKQCNDQARCTYTILADVLGDPVPGAAKDFVAQWTCGGQTLETSAPAEAGFGSMINLACGQEATNEAVTDGAITTGTPGTLVSSGNTTYTSEVELHGAVKAGATSASELTARINTSLNRALDTALPASGQFQNHYIPQAIQTIGNVSHVTPMASSTGIYDMTRFSQFFLDNRRGQAGWSTPGTGEQPQAESGLRTWSWRHRVFDYAVHFPFLAGICGLDAGVSSYISGALTYGTQGCFDGLPTAVDASGKLEFDASAYGALGCNILVASAQAGLESTINAGFEFATHVQALPPQLKASIDLYSNLDFHGFFRVRVLFWSNKWEKTIIQARLFQKHAEYSLGPTLSIPSQQICDPQTVPAGTCTDPASACDITGRCVRYDFNATNPLDPPVRVDTGECFVRAVTTKLLYEGSCTHLSCCAQNRIGKTLAPGESPPAGYSICPDATRINAPAAAIHEGERGCGLIRVTNTRTTAYTPGFMCKRGVPVDACNSETQLWLSGPVGDCNDRVICYDHHQVRVPLYDHADSNARWEGSTALVDQVGGPGATVHIYGVGAPAIASDPLCH